MITKIKKSFLLAAVSLMSVFGTAGLSLAAPVLVSANNITTSVCSGVTDAAGPDGTCPTSGNTSDPSTNLKSIATTIIKYFSYIVGVIAIIFILYGGFKYITSGGDSSKVTTAKNAIIYAIIGLIIVALAQFIVNFVLGAGQSVASQSA